MKTTVDVWCKSGDSFRIAGATPKSAVVLGTLILFGLVSAAWADAILSVGSVTGRPGENITLAVSLTSVPRNVTGANFTLTYATDAFTFVDAAVGEAASDADKTLSSNEPEAGTIKIVVFGINTNVIPDGAIALVTFKVKENAVPGDWDVGISDMACTDADANAVPVVGHDGTITVSAAEYALILEAGPGGTTVPAPGTNWLASGTTILVRAVADAHYFFSGWQGDISGESNPVSVYMDGAKVVRAVFGEYETSNGTPHWWLAQFGLATNDSAAGTDPDGDGAYTWEEYQAGTDPTDAADRFEIGMGCSGTNIVIEFQARSGYAGRIASNRCYMIQSAPALGISAWSNVSSEIRGDGTRHTENVGMAGDHRFFRVRAWLE